MKVRVVEHDAVHIDYFYDVEVDDNLTPEQARTEAMQLVANGEVDSFDSATGDAVDSYEAEYEATIDA